MARLLKRIQKNNKYQPFTGDHTTRFYGVVKAAKMSPENRWDDLISEPDTAPMNKTDDVYIIKWEGATPSWYTGTVYNHEGIMNLLSSDPLFDHGDIRDLYI